AADLYYLDNRARGLTEATVSSYKAKMAIFVRWCEEKQIDKLEALTSVDLRRFLVTLQDLELSNRYQVNLAKTVKTFLNYCVRDEFLAQSPFDKVKIPKLDKRIL